VAQSASKTSKKQKRSTFPESDGFNAMLMAIAQEKKAVAESNARHQKENAKVDKVVDLMEKWGRACEAMGSRIKAAYACSGLEQFLKRKEKKRT
jgi:non-homologous end joining protein Ku